MLPVAALVLALSLARPISADLYLHNPRGSNNRCDEKSNDVQRDNRLFDSQNNNAGGYATCPVDMSFYEGSQLQVMYTAQHGCGNGDLYKNDPNNPEITQCQIVIQLGCEDAFGKLQPTTAPNYWPYKLTDGRPAVPAQVSGSTCIDRRPLMYNDCFVNKDGNNTVCDTLNLNDQNARNVFTSNQCRCSNSRELTYGYHEPEISYHKCSVRRRNRGLFTADQNLNGDTSLYTRQNPNGGQNDRHGFECPEERDYFPRNSSKFSLKYWKPTGWRDVAVKVSDMNLCQFYQSRSENVLGRCECLNPNNPLDTSFWVYETADACNAQRGAQWTCYDPHNLPPPDCNLHEWTMDNHLGMGVTGSRQGNQASYTMTIPSIVPPNQDDLKCVLRVRYNTTNSNVPFFATNANNGIIKNNPVVFFGNRSDDDPSEAMPFRLAINTAQYSRTFEDRSYVFRIKRRTPDLQGKTIHNLNVRGKRGNIAQVRNNVEYDFVPNVLRTKQDDIVHIQWCGSDYNDPNNAGQGTAGTDRNNMVTIPSFDGNTVLPLINNNAATSPNAPVAPSIFDQETLKRLAWQDQNDTKCFSVTEMLTTQAQNQQDPRSCHFLNQASAYFSHLAVVRSAGAMFYMNTRNNNFSNRSQKGVIIADAAGLSIGQIAGIAIGSIAGAGALVAAGLFVYKRRYGELKGLKYHMMGRV
ncbi:hypothetical protein HDU97_007412 [Phlyctochytrium planicorne]|nr:hypothetical protein HDU97_007412 [Phlyctochytrium planicorne]